MLPVIRGDYTAIDTYTHSAGKSVYVHVYAGAGVGGCAPASIQSSPSAPPPPPFPPIPSHPNHQPLHPNHHHHPSAPPLDTRILALTGENDMAAGAESMAGWARFVSDPATQFAQVNRKSEIGRSVKKKKW